MVVPGGEPATGARGNMFAPDYSWKGDWVGRTGIRDRLWGEGIASSTVEERVRQSVGGERGRGERGAEDRESTEERRLEGKETEESEREKNRTVRVVSEHSSECARARKRERAKVVG